MEWQDWLSQVAAEYSSLVGRIVDPSTLDSPQAKAAFEASHSPKQYASLLKTQQGQQKAGSELKVKGIFALVYFGLVFYACGGCFGSPIGPTASFGRRSEAEKPKEAPLASSNDFKTEVKAICDVSKLAKAQIVDLDKAFGTPSISPKFREYNKWAHGSVLIRVRNGRPEQFIFTLNKPATSPKEAISLIGLGEVVNGNRPIKNDSQGLIFRWEPPYPGWYEIGSTVDGSGSTETRTVWARVVPVTD